MAKASNDNTHYGAATREGGEALHPLIPAAQSKDILPPLTEVGRVALIENEHSAANIAPPHSYHLPPGPYWLACFGIGAATWWNIASWLTGVF